jgi:hypothetical protein
MASTMKVRSRAHAVSAMRSTASTIVLTAVSTPMASEVQPMSLSMDAGTPNTRSSPGP